MTRRRGQGEGTIRHRADGRWEGRIDLGWEGGKHQSRSLYGRTRQDVVLKLRQAQHQLATGLPVVDERMTVDSYLAEWLHVVEPRLRPSTFTRYRQLVERQLIPQLGAIRLAKLSPADVSRMMAQVQQDGLSPRTAAHCRAVLRAALADAEKWDQVARNVAKLADAPHLPPPQPVVLSPEQVRTVLNACADPSLRRLAQAGITTGLRQGEQLGLRWEDIDFERRCLSVRMELQRIHGTYQLVEPKSASSRRVVALPDAALEALHAERQTQLAAQLAASRRWHQPIPGLVFTTATGAPRNGSSLTHLFQDALQKAGLPKLTWHGLRAAHGALMLASGADISVVSRKLGHSSVALTSRHYGGVADALQRDAADRLGRLLDPEPEVVV
ncbi:MAG: tyrosine-type recombinase/integrase [Candidatus Dormibacteria bacterium]